MTIKKSSHELFFRMQKPDNKTNPMQILKVG